VSDLAAIYEALSRVVDPCSIATGVPISLADMGLVQEVIEEEGTVRITLMLTSPVCWQAANIIAMVEDTVGALPGVVSVSCVLNPHAEWMPDMMNPEVRAKLRMLRPLEGAR
jgi:metal-sulfur cluster biosynthetic enzyme